MAAIVVPLLEGAALILARALAAAGGAAAGVEIAKKRTKAAEESKSTPIARSDAGTSTKKNKKCEMCPPDCGNATVESTAGWSEESINYQERIGGMPVVPGFITEWKYEGIRFDGFVSGECLLKEAKARYDQFFFENGRPKPYFKKLHDPVIQAEKQYSVTEPHPQITLRWYFMQPLSFKYYRASFSSAFPKIQVIYEP